MDNNKHVKGIKILIATIAICIFLWVAIQVILGKLLNTTSLQEDSFLIVLMVWAIVSYAAIRMLVKVVVNKLKKRNLL